MKVATVATAMLALLLSADASNAPARLQADAGSIAIERLKEIVNVFPDGKILIGPRSDYPFTIDDPEGSARAIKALHAELMALTAEDATHPGVRPEPGK